MDNFVVILLAVLAGGMVGFEFGRHSVKKELMKFINEVFVKHTTKPVKSDIQEEKQ